MLAEAEVVCRKAILLEPELAVSHSNLGKVLMDQHKAAEAEAACRKAIQLKPELAEAHANLGNALAYQGKLAEAETAYRQAIQLKPELAGVHQNLGNVLKDQRKPAEAEAAYRQAIRFDHDLVDAHFNHGNALQGRGQLDEAIAEYGEAIRLKKDFPEAHCNLGHVYLKQGRFADALAALRRGHEIGSKDPRWPYPSAQWVHKAEQLVALADKLPRLLTGESQPADAAEGLVLAEMCDRHKELYAAAARFFAGAFAADPKVAGDLKAQHRYNAACVAARAGCGEGKDAKDLPDKVSVGLRRQALEWLRADLAVYRRDLGKQPDKVGPAIRDRMQRWQQDTDFAGVRGPEALAKLPEAERQEWQKLWAEVAELLARAQKPMPEKKLAPK